MGDNDDLMIEVTGSSNKASTAIDQVIEKITKMQSAIEKMVPSLTKFTEKMDSIASSSKAFATLDKISKSTDNVASSTKKAEANEAMYQARLDRANVSMERSRQQLDKLTAAKKKSAEASEIAAKNEDAFNNIKYTGMKDIPSDVNKYSEPDINDKFDSSPFVKSKLASEILESEETPKIKVDTSSAETSLDRIQAFIDRLTPSISHMSSEAQVKFNELAASASRVSQQIDNQTAIYRNLAAESGKVARSAGEDSDAYLRLEKRMLSTDDAIDRLTSKQEKLKAQMSEIAPESQKAGLSLLQFGNRADESGRKASSSFQTTTKMMEKMLIRIAAFRIFSAIQQSIVTGIQNMALASSQANIAMSALSTDSLYLKNSIGAALMPAIEALIPVLNQVANAIADVFNTIGMLTARIFNHASSVQIAKRSYVDYAKTISQSGNNATQVAQKEAAAAQKATEKATKAQEAAAKKQSAAEQKVQKAIEDHQKKLDALKKSVMGFDELNVLTAKTDTWQAPKAPDYTSNLPTPASYNTATPPAWNGMQSPSTMFKTVKIPAWIQSIGDKVKTSLSGWEKYSEPAKGALEKLWQRLTPFKTFAAKGVQDFYNDFLKPLGIWTLGTAFPKFCDIIGNLANDIDWKALNKALDDLWKGLEPFAEVIGNGLLWFLDKVLEPLAAWCVNNIVTPTISLIGKALQGISGWAETHGTIVHGIILGITAAFATWETIKGISALRKSLAGVDSGLVLTKLKFAILFAAIIVVVAVIYTLVTSWDKLTVAQKVALIAIGALATVIGVVTAAQLLFNVSLLACPATWIVMAIMAIVAVIAILWQKNSAFRDFILGVWKGLENVGGAVGHWFENDFVGFFKWALDNIQKIWNAAPGWFGDIWKGIQNVFGTVGNWFKGIFLGAWNKVQDAWEGAGKWFGDRWNDIKSVFKPSLISDAMGNAWTWTQDKWKDAGKWFGYRWNDIKNVFKPSLISNAMGNAWTWTQDKWKGAGKWFGDRWNEIVSKFKPDMISDTFKTAWSHAQDAWKDAPNWFHRKGVDIANNIAKAIYGAINGVIGAIDWVLNKVGSSAKIKPLTVPHYNYAYGTGSHPGGAALVNDAAGSLYRELVQLPNGNTFIPQGRNVLIPDLPRGSKVLPAKETNMLFPNYAGGIGAFFGNAISEIKNFGTNIWQYISNPKKLLQLATDKFVGAIKINEPWLSLGNAAVGFIVNNAVEPLKKLLAKFEAPAGSGSGVQRWAGVASQALEMTGHFSPQNLKLLLAQMQTESSGNPNDINLWDSNAKAGHPSQGLMQVIPSTFHSYALAPYNKNILDPLSNIIAAIRYTWSRYGGPEGVWGRGHGYKSGVGNIDFSGWYKNGGVFTVPSVAGLGENGPEAAIPLNDSVFSQIAKGISRNSGQDNNIDTERILDRMEKMEHAIENMQIALYTNDQKIAESANRGNKSIDRRYHPVAQN